MVRSKKKTQRTLNFRFESKRDARFEAQWRVPRQNPNFSSNLFLLNGLRHKYNITSDIKSQYFEYLYNTQKLFVKKSVLRHKSQV